jgi:hypothetical protein
MTVPFTDDELRAAQAEARRLLAQLMKTDELDLAELSRMGGCVMRNVTAVPWSTVVRGR